MIFSARPRLSSTSRSTGRTRRCRLAAGRLGSQSLSLLPRGLRDANVSSDHDKSGRIWHGRPLRSMASQPQDPREVTPYQEGSGRAQLLGNFAVSNGPTFGTAKTLLPAKPDRSGSPRRLEPTPRAAWYQRHRCQWCRSPAVNGRAGHRLDPLSAELPKGEEGRWSGELFFILEEDFV